MGGLPPVFIEFLGKSKGVKMAMADIKAETRLAAKEGAGNFQTFGRVSKAAIMGIGIAAGAAAVGAVKMAADFETQMTRVRTGAGETAGNMKMVSDGILAMAGEVGQSTSQLTTGLYTVESAGYHGADALNVLKNSAMGAKVGAADLGTVTDAVTTALNAYKLGAGQATAVTNALIGTEAEGKTNMEALAGSMANILPTASAAHVGLNEVLGAMATMTAQGTPAAVAATYLRQTIGQLSNPSAKAANEMKSLGLSATQVGLELGKSGLAATLTTITDAIQKHMGPAGTVLIDKLKSASRNTSDFQKVLANLSPTQQTYIGALATMVGGTKSMQAALELTGPHMADFKKNTAGIAEHVKAGGKSIEGWSDVQKTLNQKIAEAKGALQGMTIQIGQYLLPVATKIMGVIAQTVTWLTKHKQIALGVAIVIGGALVVALAAAAVAMWNFTAAALANPVVWIVVGVMALVAAIVYLIIHWRQVWSEIKKIADDVGHYLSEAWNWLKNTTLDFWHGIEDGIKSVWHSIAAFFVGVWHGVADPIVSAWHWISNVTSTVWNAISGFFKKWWPLLLVIFMPFIALIVSLWNHCHKQIEDFVKTVWNGIKSFLTGVWHGISSVASAVWSVIKTVIVKPIEEVWHWLEGKWRSISHWLEGEWLGISRIASNLWGRIRRGMIQPIEDAWHSLTNTMGRIAATIYNKLHGAWVGVSRIGSWFLSIGSAIVHGIINGVEGAAGGLYDSLRNLAGNALDAAKSFLGINSPSKVFAMVVGKAIPEGIGKGVDDHAYLAHQSVVSLSQGLASARADLGSVMLETGAYGAYGGAYGGSNGVPLQQEIYFQLDGETLFKGMQKTTLQYNRRNRSNGLSLAH
jgi:TP901 family phage tail tape measure protein